MNFKSFLILFLTFIICSCSLTTRTIIKGKGDIKLKQVNFSDLKGWANDNHSEALISFNNSCNKFETFGDSRQIGGQIGDITIADFRDVCEIAEVVKGMSSKQARNFFENWFTPFLVEDKNSNSEGLFTGYYEPELRGSKIKSDIYKYPVYAKPKDLGTDPYISRKEINEGALAGKDLEIVYVDDKVDLLFMHIQGSGRVILTDGVVLKLAFAGRNNQPYSSIGSYMIEHNIIPKNEATYDNIKNWLKNNPDKADEVMNVNSSYVFFKISNNEYPVGAQGTPLMAERSLAVDSEIIPYGYPIWLDTKAKLNDQKIEPYQKLLISQDTGSAIKGAVRGDIFFGRGKVAEKMASQMNNKGRYYILLPANIVDKFIMEKNR